MPRKQTCTRENCERVLKNLSDGTAPFIALAAERAGLNRNTVKGWIAQAERDLTTDETVHWFASEVRRIRAEWMAKTTRDMQKDMGDNKTAHHVIKARQWLMERVDRDLFDISNRYLPKGAEKVQAGPNQPIEATIEPGSMHAVLDELERPDQYKAH